MASTDPVSSPPTESESPRAIFKKDRVDELYAIEKLVGEGNYAEVYRARCRVTKEKVAIKRLMRKPGDKEQALSIEREELYMGKDINHPNVIRLRHMFKTPRMVCIVQDLADCGDIAKYMKREKHFSEKDAKVILVQVLKGLAHLHDHGVVHRDIKPGNILFSTNGDVKIADFGLSAIIKEGETTTTGMYGTPYYAAPEVFRNEHYTTVADMWSLGVMVYFMLSGSQAFEAENSRAVKARVLQGTFDMESGLWSSISAEAKSFISRLIEMDPKKRATAEQAQLLPWITDSLPNNSASSIPPTDKKDNSSSPRAITEFTG
eukprot:CAMPEP_0184681878 /NCGR_PEP_ID=MMETSP0312-20130426/4876_1 /TAXON_ID=31354 /ORGANISM="Compsopogon coeruleus, Strain SAG 36.94" /LENGTH=318 /DNA_ID=CAMNT_0027133007 /DNA_START=161 /DNA_END=1117 /DNA_ORIENTATION=-